MNWRPALYEWAEARLGDAFEWGRTDCALLMLEACDIIRGTDDATDYRGRWQTRIGAIRYIAETETPSDYLRKAGARTVALHFQQAGDILLAQGEAYPDFRDCAHVCLGRRSLTADPEQGVVNVITGELTALDPPPLIWRLAECRRH